MSKRDRTIEQVEAAQRKAVRFAENVLADDDKAAELASLSPEEYADRKRLRIINPTPATAERNRLMPKQPTRAELLERIEELEEALSERDERLDNIAQMATPEEEEEDDDTDDDEEYEDED